MTGPETPRKEPITDLTATARDTFADTLAFMEARSRAAGAAATRNSDVNLTEQFREYDAQQAGEPSPPPPNDSHQ